MGTYEILCHGNEGQVTVETNSASATFTGTIKSANGDGLVSGTIAPDGSLVGSASLGDHIAGFTANISGDTISGTINVFGWPFPFEGTKVA